MRSSRMLFQVAAISWMIFALCACDPGRDARGDEHLIGEKLKDVSSMTTATGESQQMIAMYDKTVNRIHQFDLAPNILVRSFQVLNPGVDHHVLYDQTGNYMVDFSTKHLSIFDKFNEVNHNPIRFIGTPKSASFRPSLGFLVMYDDKMSVGVLKLDVSGKVLKSKVFGADFGGPTISAGDVDETGRLILALSSGKIAIVDLSASLNSGSWSYTLVNTTLNNCVWLAPIRGSPNKVFVQQEDRMSVVDLVAQTSADGPLISRKSVMYYGKMPDAHIIYESASDTSLMKIAYINAGVIATKQVSFAPRAIMNSRLDLANNSWTMISAKSSSYNYRNGKTTYNNRAVTRWTFTSNEFVGILDEKLSDAATFEVNADRLFALLPVKMGWAVNYNLNNGSQRPLKYFNMPFIE